ncbi:MAG TPA: glycosyltransferase family 39 protein [Candidatus Binatia bacterium]|jgi:hypothetical protein
MTPSHPRERKATSPSPRTGWQRLVGLIPLVFGIWYFVALAPYGLHVGEDGDILYEAFAAYRGQLPYIDFSTGYTPAYFFWHAALFHVFGVNVVVLRIAAAIANGLTLWFLYLLAARVVRPTLALVPPLIFAASLPIYPGEFCSFNVAYPAWYNITFWLGSMLALAAYIRHERVLSVLIAGILAGLNFAFKPNIGLFNLAGLAVFLLWWHAPARTASRFERASWWGVAAATLAGVLAIFGVDVLSRKFALFPLPFLIAALVALAAARRQAGRPRFVRGALALFVGMALPNVPWIVYFLGQLGVRGFLHDVLLIGSTYEPFFFIAYRPLFSGWDLAMLALVAVLYMAPFAMHRGRLPLWTPFAAAGIVITAGLGYIAFLAPMRDGFHTALVSRYQDLAFFAVQLVIWVGIGYLGTTVGRAPADRSRRTATIVLFALCGPALALGMHPRSDFMHLLISVPATLLVAVVLADELLAHWHAVLHERRSWRWAVSLALGAPVLLLLADLVAPGVIMAARLTRYYAGLDPRPWARLDLPRATLVREPGNDREFDTLHAIATYVDAHTQPNDYVFPFPNLSLLCFLSGRLNPTPKGYFIAGYPDHYTEAAVVTALRDRPPTMVLSLAEHQIFVVTAPAYYFLIREFVQQRFEPTAQIGPYVALMHRDAHGDAGDEQPPPRIAADAREPSWDGLDDPDPVTQALTARRIEKMRDPGGAVALARRAVSRKTPNRMLFLRIASQFADERAIPSFVQIAGRDFTSDAGQLAATSLFYTAEKSLNEHFWLASQAQSARLKDLRAELGVEPFRTWLHNRRADGRLRYVAAWAAGVLHDEAAIPDLLKAVDGDDVPFATMASFSLVALGKTAEVADAIVAALDVDDTYAPSILIDLYHRDPKVARAAIRTGLDTGSATTRATLSWVVAAVHDRTLADAVADLNDDASTQVREAAAWSAAWLSAPPPAASAEPHAPAREHVLTSAAAP